MRLDPIVIIPYDASWPEQFDRECERIEPFLSGWTTRPIEHIGSTSVPGLPAKPIIDMLAVVNDIQPPRRAANHLLDRVGWEHAPEPLDEIERALSFCYPDVARRTHHMHVVEERSGDWRGWLAFRDYLRANDHAAVAYASLKTRLAEAHGQDPNQRDAYRQGKADFIRTITATALRQGLPRLDQD